MDESGGSIWAQRPDSVKRLRACKRCKLIKTEEQFVQYACDNCPQPDKAGKGYRAEWMESNTTDDYDGMVSMMQPDSSWVARWLSMKYRDDEGRTVAFKPGLYAIALPGEDAIAAAGEEVEENSSDEYEDEEEAEEGGRASGGAASSVRPPAMSAAAAAAIDRDDPSVRERAVADALVDD